MIACIAHFVETAAGRRYRIWDQRTSSYRERKGVTTENLYRSIRQNRLVRALSGTYGGSVRNLTGSNWWRFGRNNSSGTTEPLEFPEDRGSPEEITDRACRMAWIAESAIEAYEKYLAEGGDPSVLPEMLFTRGRFTVRMHNISPRQA